MKKHTFLLILATATLCACGGGNQKSDSGIIELSNFADDSCIARRIAKNVVLQKLDSTAYAVVDWQQLPNTRPDNELTSFYTGKINDSISSVNIYCYNMHDGRYAVLYETDIEKPWKHLDNKTYLYENNILTPRDSIFPTPNIYDFYSNFYDFPKPVQVLLTLQIDRLRFYQFDNDKSSVLVGFTNMPKQPYVVFGYSLDVVYPKVEYKWTGKVFESDPKSEYRSIINSEDYIRIKEKAGVGNYAEHCVDSSFIYFGEHPNYYITGNMGEDYPHVVVFAEQTEGGKGAGFALYCRKNDGTYYIHKQNNCVGQFRFTNMVLTRDKVLQVSVADDGDNNQYTYYIKNVPVTYDDGDTYQSLQLIGGKKGDKEYLYPDGQSFDFNTFKFGEDVFELCDMRAVWEQIDDDEEEADSHLEFAPNMVSYELGMYYMRTREIKSFPIGGGAFHVVDLYNYERWYDEQVSSYSYNTQEYIFKDGKLTRIDVQPEIEQFSNKFYRHFVCDTLVAEMRIEFQASEKACLKWDPDSKKFKLLFHDKPKNNNDNADDDQSVFPSNLASLDKFDNFHDKIIATGDFNQDNIKDYAIAIYWDDNEWDLALYFGDGNGGGKLQTINGCKYVSSVSITDKGVLRIQCSEEYFSATLTYLFRYQDDDFYLIGGKEVWDKSEPISYNFLTNQQTEGKTTTTFSERPLRKFSDVRIGFIERIQEGNYLDDTIY